MAGASFFSQGAKAEAKAALARAGLPWAPGATAKMIRPPSGTASVVILDRVMAGVRPDYCIHGNAQCVSCFELCWLGSATHDIVNGGEAYPLCMECAREKLPDSGAELVDRRVDDHRRADGPHPSD